MYKMYACLVLHIAKYVSIIKHKVVKYVKKNIIYLRMNAVYAK